MMLKKILLFLPVLLLAGCASHTFTRMTPSIQPRNADNQYSVEVAFNSEQQSIRWDSVKAYALVNGQPYPLRPVPLVKNRWDGYIPVSPTQDSVTYRFKFDFLYNSFGKDPQPDSVLSQPYVLKIVGQ